AGHCSPIKSSAEWLQSGSQRPNLLAAQSFDACRTTPASRAHAHVSTCREFQIVAGENVPRVLDLQLLATSEEIPFWQSNRAVDLFLAQLLNHDVSHRCGPVIGHC